MEYLSLKGYDVFLMHDVFFKATDFQPHIYTDDEILRYFSAVDSYSSGNSRMDAIQFPVLFRLLYCCGTRINETLGIRKRDVDLDNGIIRLLETKNDCERFIVLSAAFCGARRPLVRSSAATLRRSGHPQLGGHFRFNHHGVVLGCTL